LFGFLDLDTLTPAFKHKICTLEVIVPHKQAPTFPGAMGLKVKQKVARWRLTRKNSAIKYTFYPHTIPIRRRLIENVV